MNAAGTDPCPICWARLRYGDGPAHMAEHRREGWTQAGCKDCGRFVWVKLHGGRWLCGECLPVEVRP